jgi:hypothetical protein
MRNLESVLRLMDNAKTPEDWEVRVQHVRASNNGRLPLCWYDVTKLLGITERPATRWGGA